MLLASKLNKLRTIALGLVFLGIIVMYFGFLWPSWMVFFFIFGLVVMLSSFGIYFWAGMLSTQAVKVQCPECGKITKMLGTTDQCMFCKTTLSLDPKYAPDSKKDDPSGDRNQLNEH